jgi:hypothetical protein
MALKKITAPGSPVESIADWDAVVAQLANLVLDKEAPIRVLGSNILKGAIFNHGGALYIADADTAISGSASDYVKITASGDDDASAAFVSDLTGVDWDSAYKGYYDEAGNLYVFDELKALALEAISVPKKESLGIKNLAERWAAKLVQGIPGVPTIERIASGSGTWTAPAGVYRFKVACIGGGGGGANGSGAAAGGGGAGTKVSDVIGDIIECNPGDTFAYAVGEGGAGGVGADGADGQNTTFAGATTGPGSKGGGLPRTGGAPGGARNGNPAGDSGGPGCGTWGGKGGGAGGAGAYDTNGEDGGIGGGGGGSATGSGGHGGRGMIIIEY